MATASERLRERSRGRKRKKGLTKNKACTMLHEGVAQGKKITDKQRRMFGAVCGGQSPK